MRRKAATSFRLTGAVGLKPSCFLADWSKNSFVGAVVDIWTTSQETWVKGRGGAAVIPIARVSYKLTRAWAYISETTDPGMFPPPTHPPWEAPFLL